MGTAPHPVTLRQLQYIVAVADQRSFRGAAEVCAVAQPSLSVQVSQVEDALGVRLFERSRRGVVVTEAGQRCIEGARRLLAAADELVATVRGLADPLSGSLSLGVIPTIGPYLLPEVAPVLRERFAKLTFIWSEDKTAVLLDKLDRAELDGAILALESDLGGRPHLPLGADPFVFAAAAGHPLVQAKRPIRPADLEGERVFLLDDGHCFRDQALAICTKAGAEEAGYRATSLPTLVQMAAGGAGVTLLPSLAVGVENRRGALKVRSFAPKAPQRTIGLVWRKGSAREPALRAIAEVMKAVYDRLPR